MVYARKIILRRRACGAERSDISPLCRRRDANTFSGRKLICASRDVRRSRVAAPLHATIHSFLATTVSPPVLLRSS
jgi:hypothetical protein